VRSDTINSVANVAAVTGHRLPRKTCSNVSSRVVRDTIEKDPKEIRSRLAEAGVRNCQEDNTFATDDGFIQCYRCAHPSR
jgi:hypothetical protein